MIGDTTQQAERDLQRMQTQRSELVEWIERLTRQEEAVEPLAGLHLFRLAERRGPIYGVTEPSFCVIAQGSKEILQGGYRYRYDPYHYLLATVDLPRVSQILEASAEKPYLSLRLDLSPSLVSSVILDSTHSGVPNQTNVRAIDVSLLEVDLLDAVVRLIRLVDCPSEAQMLMPLILREIVYRLLKGEQGARLRHLAVQGDSTSYIARAVERLRRDFDQPLRIETLARDLGMSVSGFHHHFKAVTSLSPLQYQKQLRLQEARRLMMGKELDAASAAFRVGYQDASHFSREYKSLFGVPPMRDVQQLREAARESIG